MYVITLTYVFQCVKNQNKIRATCHKIAVISKKITTFKTTTVSEKFQRLRNISKCMYNILISIPNRYNYTYMIKKFRWQE